MSRLGKYKVGAGSVAARRMVWRWKSSFIARISGFTGRDAGGISTRSLV
jgi:hypothetical protein